MNVTLFLKKTLFYAVALAFACVLVAVIVEGGMRLYFSGTLSAPRFNEQLRVLDAHPTRGLALIPNASAVIQLLDFRTEVKINSKGFRDVEHNYEKPDGVFRIVVVGDSFIEGWGVPIEDAFPRVLEDRLRPRNVEVIALGVRNYGTVAEYVALLEEGRRYEPDLVLLAFFALNDVHNNSRALSTVVGDPRQRNVVGRPYIVSESGEYPVETKVPNYEQSALQLDQVRLQLERNKRRFLTTEAIAHIQRVRKGRGIDVGYGRDPNVRFGVLATKFNVVDVSGPSVDEYAAMWDTAWDHTFQAIDAMNRFSESIGAKFLCFSIPARCQVVPRFRERVVEAFPSMRFDFDRPEKVLADAADEYGFAYLNLAPMLRSAAVERDIPVYYSMQDSHWTVHGHRLAAETVAEYLVGNGYAK